MVAPPGEPYAAGAEQQLQDSQHFIDQFIQQISSQQPLQPAALGLPTTLQPMMNPVITTSQISQAAERALRAAQAQPDYLDRQVGVSRDAPAPRQPSMMSDMKRRKARRRSKNNTSQKAPQLHVYNYLAKKVEGQAGVRQHNASVGARPLVLDQRAPLATDRPQRAAVDAGSGRYATLPIDRDYASDRLNKMFNTMTHLSGPWHQQPPMRTVQGPFQAGPPGQDTFGSQLGSTYKSAAGKGNMQPAGLSRNHVGSMNRTIMPVASGWWQQAENPMLNTARYAPHSTGYSSAVGASQSVDCTVDRMTDVQVKRDLRIHPARQSLGSQHSAAMGSTCLLDKPMLDGVGQFKKRPLRQRESFGQRNARLGHLATRASYGA